MRSGNLRALIATFGILLSVACSSSSESGSKKPTTPALPACTAAHFAATAFPVVGSAGANANVMKVTVNGSLCGAASSQYPNEPCTSVTICSPSDPSQCQTINNILLDTGSYGLRIFSSVITVPLTPITNGSSQLAECVQFGSGNSEWGPVEYAYVQLGTEPAVSMPILAINSSYGIPPTLCSAEQSFPDTGPQEAGFNGILGVGLLAQDCGSQCVNSTDNGQYYSCTGANCSCGASVDLAAQVQNPVPLLPTDNNGVLLQLPAVASTDGTTSVDGSLYLGIGTQTNNTPSGVTTYEADASGNFSTVFGAYGAQSMPGFLDSGSNTLFFPAPTSTPLPDCGSYGKTFAGFFCPGSVQSFSAVNTSNDGTTHGSISFQVGNAYTLLNSTNSVFNDLSFNSLDPTSGSGAAIFDWGLPFFFGRSVYVGVEGTSSTLGKGMYWAF